MSKDRFETFPPRRQPQHAQELPEGPRVASRHIVFLREGVDSVIGNHIFAVENLSGAEAPFKSTVTLPRKTVDFGTTEGIEPQNVRHGVGSAS